MQLLFVKIEEIVGKAGIIIGDEVSSRPTNWLGLGNREAKAIIRPKTTQELSQVMQLCHAADQSVVPAGGLSGLVQGTDTVKDDVLISLERMREIEVVDEAGATMIVQAGTPLQLVQERAEQSAMSFAVDLGARGSASIGGLIATNAGGNSVIRYGMMREQVLGLEAVLADGTIISSMNSMLKNNAGYDLKQLFIGSEGTLGIVTRAVLRLRPQMISTNTVLVAVNDFENITKILKMFSSELGGTLNAFEVMWQNYYSLILGGNKQHKAPLPDEYAYYILIEACGGDQQIDAARFMQVLETALADELILDAVVASSEEQRNALWAIRDDIITLVMTMLPAAAFDVSLPIGCMEEYIDDVTSNMQDKWGDKAKLVVFGHLGDSNIHLAIGTGVENELDHGEVEQVVYQPLAAYNGSVSAEHGIGLEKRDWLSTSRSKTELDLMRSLKTMMDPKNILNPGKVLG
ncbi:MAG: FAD-binding oxidoreductase [Robiginitomaculum sp.]|nr:FAD-binding oxidoreductase [Robiginitomaculum sp.]